MLQTDQEIYEKVNKNISLILVFQTYEYQGTNINDYKLSRFRDKHLRV